MSLWLEAAVPDVSPDSATELWKTEPQDAGDQGGNTCILREEARMPQSTGGALRIGLESSEPTALLPRAETLPEPTEQVFALRLQDKKLPPLLSEIWDVHE
ncbi:nuclear receptor subfamily 1, group H, member 3, isoform CRA_b [Rattus norvegicus]|uniref:Nuclear receptor subfamily 1, group H, member 3, isoform CRA_b n=1 Tax=Rattus norvegicus TaxID=10116 RepID=A6HNB2_RAT|nr:nuclear receptor subfamily 1, group H, member 3, isoform CRA_b [Rattus norvegicus]